MCMCTNGRDPSHAGHLPSQAVIQFVCAPGRRATLECRKSCGSDKTARNLSAESDHSAFVVRTSVPEPPERIPDKINVKYAVDLLHVKSPPIRQGDVDFRARYETDSAGHHRDSLDGALRERRGEAVVGHSFMSFLPSPLARSRPYSDIAAPYS